MPYALLYSQVRSVVVRESMMRQSELTVLYQGLIIAQVMHWGDQEDMPYPRAQDTNSEYFDRRYYQHLVLATKRAADDRSHSAIPRHHTGWLRSSLAPLVMLTRAREARVRTMGTLASLLSERDPSALGWRRPCACQRDMFTCNLAVQSLDRFHQTLAIVFSPDDPHLSEQRRPLFTDISVSQ